jgi:hypothetical protein
MCGLNYVTPPVAKTVVSQDSKSIFAGNIEGADLDPVRVSTLQQLRPQLVVGSPVKKWKKAGFVTSDPVAQQQMHRVYNGHVGLSTQRRPEMQDCMSNRALLVTGGHGLLYAQRFQHSGKFFEDDEAIWFDKPKPYVYSPEHAEVQRKGFERAWRDYSWPVVVRKVLTHIGVE